MPNSDSYSVTAAYYDHVVPYRARNDVPFFVGEAVRSGGPVLEIGCGTGRVLIPTARAGVRITGLDGSPAMLEVCRKKVAHEPSEVAARIRLVEADMRDFDTAESYALITMPFRPFQHLLTVTDQLACLETVHRHLEPSGRLILDVFNPLFERLVEGAVPSTYDEEPEGALPGGRVLRRKSRVIAHDRAVQCITAELVYTIVENGETVSESTEVFPLRYFFRFEMEHLLARCGFTVDTVYADYEGAPFGSRYPSEILCIAKKT